MDREKLSTFIKAAEEDLASVRNSLLIVAQRGDVSGLDGPRRLLSRLGKGALECGQPTIAAHIADCDGSLRKLGLNAAASPMGVAASLDQLAAVEAALLKLPLTAGTFLPNVDEFVDESFQHLLPHEDLTEPKPAAEEFEIDEETLEIFRGEAEELLASVDLNVRKLGEDASNQRALWEIRRNAHTLKGSAGIVGLRDAAEIAHRMEDLLDRLVDLRVDPAPSVLAFLEASSRGVASIVHGHPSEGPDVELLYAEAAASLSQTPPVKEPQITAPLAPGRIESIKPSSGPIVRVSLDRLDDLIKISRSLSSNHSALAASFADLRTSGLQPDEVGRSAFLIETQRRLMEEMQSKLLHVRMVRFGNLETRLARTVHVTCVDEGKLAGVQIENGEVEIDTQIIDALIEPLLHLLKNAVVHGIESPDVRRLIGKPEKGHVSISVESDAEFLVLTVKDDGGGIAVEKLKEKALANGSTSAPALAEMPDREALKLIFDRGLTTAAKVDMNAGRGVGMSIVKEAVEARGGTVHIESELQRGTEITIMLPLRSEPPAPLVPEEGWPQAGVVGAAGGQFDSHANASDSDQTPLVLIVDDSASIRKTTARYVEEAGFRAITANNGAEALELLLNGTHEPDLILSDVEMPQIDGWALLEYLKTDDNLGHIPVVMVTSLDADEHRARAFELGASDYLVKPFSSADVDRVLGIIAPAAA